MWRQQWSDLISLQNGKLPVPNAKPQRPAYQGAPFPPYPSSVGELRARWRTVHLTPKRGEFTDGAWLRRFAPPLAR